MADAMIAVKMFFVSSDNQETNQIRRFNFANNGSVFAQVIRKIAECINDGAFYVAWKDVENDMIRVESDEELQVAVQSMAKDGVLKLYVYQNQQKSTPKVTFKDATDSGVSTARSEATPAYKPQGTQLHIGITCDGCNGAVQGTRYKCLSCADYDLCGQCEAAAVHPDHDMIVVRDPSNSEWKKLWTIGYTGRSAVRGGWPWGPRHGPRGCGPHGCGPQPPVGPAGLFGPVPTGGPASTACGPRGGWGPRHGHWQTAQMSPEQKAEFEKMQEQRAARRAARKAFEEETRRSAPKFDGPTVELDIDLNRPLNEVLTNVNEQVLDALNKIAAARAAQPKPAETTQAPAPAETVQSTGPTEILQETVTETVVPAEPAPAQIYPNLAQAQEFAEKVGVAQTSRAASVAGDRTPSENDNDWTFLAGTEQENMSVDESARGLIEEPTTSASAPSAYDPRVDAALKAMEEMGFKNEGNILRALLENYNGDIAKVLDTIH